MKLFKVKDIAILKKTPDYSNIESQASYLIFFLLGLNLGFLLIFLFFTVLNFFSPKEGYLIGFLGLFELKHYNLAIVSYKDLRYLLFSVVLFQSIFLFLFFRLRFKIPVVLKFFLLSFFLMLDLVVFKSWLI